MHSAGIDVSCCFREISVVSKAAKLTCPDCGGVLGVPEAGETRCICYSPEPDLRSSNSDTQRIELSGSKSKICIMCGKDVSGHRRFKDSRGYMCLPCGKAEEQAKKVGTIECPECHRRLKPGGFLAYKGKRICRTCYDNHKTLDPVKIITSKAYERHERRNLLILAAVFLVLLLVVLYSWFTRGFTFLH
jgi:DNA-directed RNA polymerase subunit RPC12/RpoP